MTEWFREWFGEEYLHLYPHRDEADAGRVVRLIRSALPWQPGWTVLDVGCGAGRHAAALAREGVRPVGVDLSASLLRRARAATGLPLVRADMRWLPVRGGVFDLVVSLFTSFGYFATDEEHQRALHGMVGAVRPGGWFVMDYLNPAEVRRSLVDRETVEVGGRVFDIARALADGGRFVVKTIETPEGRRFQERVRLYEPAALEAMLEAAGAPVARRYGDYDGGPLVAASPRCILIGRRA